MADNQSVHCYEQLDRPYTIGILRALTTDTREKSIPVAITVHPVFHEAVSQKFIHAIHHPTL